jgi:site-specific DNA recombinase
MNNAAVIYARVSTDEQAEKGYSLPHQLNECRRYAQYNGLVVIQEFTDDFSGAKLERPGFKKLQESLKRNDANVVIVYTADRLSRNVVDFLVLRDNWEKSGIDLHYVDRGKSQNSFEGLLTDGIFALLAHGERLKIIQRTTDGRHNKAKSNRVVMSGIPPYGYRRVGKGGEAEYVIDETEAEVVRNIFQWYVYGDGACGPISLRAISYKLDQMGITPPNYRAHVAPCWYPNSIRVILTNYIYTGVTYYGKVKTVDGKRIPRPKNEWIPIQVPHLALVDKATFELAYARAERNKELAKRNRKRDYLLSGHFRCGMCNKVMFGFLKDPNGKNPQYFYRCSSNTHKGTKCDNAKTQISMARVDEAIWEWLSSFLKDEESLSAGIRAMLDERENHLEPKMERLNTIEGLLASGSSKIHRLVDELSQYDGVAVRDAIREKVKAIETERKILLEEQSRLVVEIEQSRTPPNFESQLRKVAELAKDKIADATLQNKRMLLDAFNVRVVYCSDPEVGDILHVSCAIPDANNDIVFSSSRKWWPCRCRCSIASPPTRLSWKSMMKLGSMRRRKMNNKGDHITRSPFCFTWS